MSILQIDFPFPRKKLSEMTPAEKEQLAAEIARHHQTAGSDRRPVEINPSQVIDPQSPEGRAIYEERRRRRIRPVEVPAGVGTFRFDPKLGYIVDREDPGVVRSRVTDARDVERILQEGPKPADPEMIRLHELSQMDTPDRDAEERFSGI